MFPNVDGVKKMMQAQFGWSWLVILPVGANGGWRSTPVEPMNTLDDATTTTVLALMVYEVVDVAANHD